MHRLLLTLTLTLALVAFSALATGSGHAAVSPRGKAKPKPMLTDGPARTMANAVSVQALYGQGVLQRTECARANRLTVTCHAHGVWTAGGEWCTVVRVFKTCNKKGRCSSKTSLTFEDVGADEGDHHS